MEEKEEFSVERFIASWDAVTFSKHDLPDTIPFLDAFKDILIIFDICGSGFGFVKQDIVTKVGIIREIYEKDPDNSTNLQDMVEREVAAKTARNKKKAGVSRNLLRLMWAILFIRTLLREIGTKEDLTMQEGVRIAYDKALKEHHPWVIRTAVAAAIHFVPSKETFLQKISIDLDRKNEYLERVENALGPLIDKMYSYYEEHGLLDLP
jgi:hypothetical protein